MKKVIWIILILVFMTALISGCNKSNNKDYTLKFSFDQNGNYTGFSNLPDKYTIQAAKNDGYFVTQDSKVVGNNNVWDNFVNASLSKENTGIRIVQFNKESVEGPYFLDLFYNDGYYYMFDSSSKSQVKQPYLYLRTLEGKFGNPLKNSGAIVLTNDNALTFDMVMKAMLSSNIDYIKSIPAHKIVMFK